MTPVRDAAPGDREAVEPLWAACLGLHGARFDPAAFAGTWGRIVDPAAGLGMRVALRDGAVAGLATHFEQRDSWSGRLDGCLDTLFVAPPARGSGLARALVGDLKSLAAQRGWRTLFWHVEAGNAQARALYDHYGAADGFVRYRIEV